MNEPVKNEEIPSYKGFDSFDDIDIGKPDQDFLDSGLYSLTAEAPVTRKSLQPFDFADIGINVRKRERWSLSPLRKRYVLILTFSQFYLLAKHSVSFINLSVNKDV